MKVETVEGKYKLKKVRLDVDAEVKDLDMLLPWMDLLRSDHSRFWYHKFENYTSFPAVLITDTGSRLYSFFISPSLDLKNMVTVIFDCFQFTNSLNHQRLIMIILSILNYKIFRLTKRID